MLGLKPDEFEVLEYVDNPDAEPCAEERQILAEIGRLSRRLNELGWKDPHPYSDAGKALLILEVGSTGIHNGYCYDVDSDGVSGYIIHDGEAFPTKPFKVRENL